MKKQFFVFTATIAAFIALIATSTMYAAPASADVDLIEATATSQQQQPLLVRVVNFKSCIELSKLGKQEQANFEGLKKQLEGLLEQKEMELQEIAAKFNDPDYLDSLSAEAENELKHKYRTLSQDVAQHQNFYMQTLSQTNQKIMQKLADAVQAASEKVAKAKGYDFILNEEMSFFHGEKYDVSKEVIALMDEAFVPSPKIGS